MLSIRTATDSSTRLVTLTGDLDLSNAAELGDALDDAAASDATEVVVDLSGLRFIDSTGLGLLLVANRDLTTDGRRFLLMRGTPIVQRVFAVCGVADTFTYA